MDFRQHASLRCAVRRRLFNDGFVSWETDCRPRKTEARAVFLHELATYARDRIRFECISGQTSSTD